MKNSIETCSSCTKFSLKITLALLGIMAILFIAASQNVFAETSVTIPNEASDPSCADSGTCFLPSEVTVSVGDTVTWSNDSSVIHTVTGGNSNDGPDGTFDSQIIIGGGSFSQTFPELGQYQYFCSVHPWMTGTVLVQ